MRKIYLLLIVVFFVLQLKAQFIYDEYDEVVPFSQTEKYKDVIGEYETNTLLLSSYNNDSLCAVYNNGKKMHELGTQYTGGIDLDIKAINFKKAATKIEFDRGTIWRFAVKSKTAEEVGIKIKKPNLVPGSYLCIIAEGNSSIIQPPKVYLPEDLLNERIRKFGISRSILGQKLIIELFEPKSVKTKNQIIINSVDYGFVPFEKWRRDKTKTEESLKSGGWGSTQFPSCQYDVKCPEVGGGVLQNEANSVVFVRIRTKIDGKYEFFKGSGFFLNKTGDYSNEDKPLFFTCGHLLAPFYGGSIQDFSLGNYDMYLYAAYQNADCNNDPNINRGIELGCDYTQIDLGSSYNKSLNPYYESNEDYLIMQVSKTVKKLSNYNVVYSAWSKNFALSNSNNVGYTVIGHPGGDAKKVLIDSDKAYTNADGFELYFDIGVTESGLSGSPVFNSAKQVIGWFAGYSPNADCSTVGQTIAANLTGCGTLEPIFTTAFPLYLDPNGTGEATSSNPAPPIPPAHCSNCIQDYDETSIDCGGADCYPCGMQDVVALKTPMDIPGSVKSRYEIFAEPDPNTLLALKGGDYSLEAGMNIYLKGGFVVEKGATFYAGIDSELMTEADRGCQNPCIAVDGLFTPNGDGNDDFVRISQTFVTKYDIKVYTGRTGANLVYQVNNIPIYGNGLVNIWDGTGAIYSYNRIILTYYDCNGSPHTWPFSVTAVGLKSALITDQIDITTEIKETEKIPQILVYPNPFSNKVSIEYSGNEFPVKYRITDLNGKLITEGKTGNQTEFIDLNEFASGSYIINVKAGECNLIQKLIKE